MNYGTAASWCATAAMKLPVVWRVTVGTRDQNPQISRRIGTVMVAPDLIVFDMDGVLVEVGQSYREAIRETVKHFTGAMVSHDLIQDFKNAGRLEQRLACFPIA